MVVGKLCPVQQGAAGRRPLCARLLPHGAVRASSKGMSAPWAVVLPPDEGPLRVMPRAMSVRNSSNSSMPPPSVSMEAYSSSIAWLLTCRASSREHAWPAPSSTPALFSTQDAHLEAQQLEGLAELLHAQGPAAVLVQQFEAVPYLVRLLRAQLAHLRAPQQGSGAWRLAAGGAPQLRRETPPGEESRAV